MADKASRGLVIYGDGLAPPNLINTNNPNLNSFASRAYCGFLSLPNSENEDKRAVREFLQLLDACEDSSGGVGEDNNAEKCKVETLPERFMGMKLAVITDNFELKSVGAKLGLTVYQLGDLVSDGIPSNDSSINSLAPKLLNLLGFQEGKALETSPFDLIFVHISGNECTDENVKFVDNLVGAILNLADGANGISSRLHMSVIMSYRAVLEEKDSPSVLETKYDNSSAFPQLLPQQSYTMKGSNPRRDVRHHCPMLLAQWQDGVTRKDLAKCFSLTEFRECGGMLTIPADRFIHEVAFKLWKAPKYGA